MNRIIVILAFCPLALRPAPAADSRLAGYVIDTVAGSDLVGDNGPATAAQLSDAKGIATDVRGNVYIADTDNHRVRRLATSGIMTTVAGNGHAGFRGDGGPAELAQLDSPYGVATDSAGNLYIADLNNHRIRRVSPSGIITTIAGTGRKGSGGDGGEAVRAQLMSPRNLLVDSAGSLYVSEFEGHRVRKVTPDGLIRTIAGTGISGMNVDPRSPVMPAINAQLSYPAGLAMDRLGFLYIADSGNNLVRRIAGDMIVTVLDGRGPLSMYAPVSLAVDQAGYLFVVDRMAFVRVFMSGDLKPVAGSGTSGYDGDGGPAIAAKLTGPRDIALDGFGNLYIADGRRVRKVTGGVISTVAGDAWMRAIGDGNPATMAQLRGPKGIALDTDGNLYIADTGTERIRKVAGGLITTVAGNGKSSYESDGVAALQASLNAPEGVWVDERGGIFVADTMNHRVRRVVPPTFIVTVGGTGSPGVGAENSYAVFAPLRTPRSVAVDAAGNVYVADTGNHRILCLRTDAKMQTVAGNGSAGYAGDGGRAPLAQLSAPAAVTLDAAGNLYIADTYNHLIRKVTTAGVITTVAGIGTSGFAGDEGPATAARLNFPGGVAVDRDGYLYIADTWNHRIRMVTADGIIHTIAGSAQPGFGGDGGLALEARLSYPAGVAVDAAGVVYFADCLNHRVRKLMPQFAAIAPEPILEASIVNAASLQPGPVAPGERVLIFDPGIGTGKVRVLFDGTPAPLFLVQSGQTDAQVPYEVAGRDRTLIEIEQDGAVRAQMLVRVAEAAPALYPGIMNQDGSANSPANAAPRDSIVTLLATGEGQTNPGGVTGKAAEEPYPQPVLAVSLTIGGYPVELQYAGSAPGLVGVMQISARVPGGFAPTGLLPVVLAVGTAQAPPASIAVR